MQPPTHEIDAHPQYVDITDPAWDWDRVKAEKAKMKEAGQDADDHPVLRYLYGKTRYSLDAASPVLGEDRPARAYFKGGVEPTIWIPRRIGRRAYRANETLLAQGDEKRAAEEACRYGVESVTGPRAVALKGGGPAPLADDDLDAIWETDPTLIDRLGTAVMKYSAPITRAEGKR